MEEISFKTNNRYIISYIRLRLWIENKIDLKSEKFLYSMQVINKNIPNFDKGEKLPFRVISNDAMGRSKKGFYIDIDVESGRYPLTKEELENINFDQFIQVKYEQ